jgi:hypothetical protein
MTDLSVLIPPFLMCAAVIVAIVAFLRHEMGRARLDRQEPGDENSGPVPTPGNELDDSAGSEVDTSASARRDG